MTKDSEKVSVEALIEHTKALSWDDIILEPELEIAKENSNKALIGKLVSSNLLNKYTFHSMIRAVWSFVKALTIEQQIFFCLPFPPQLINTEFIHKDLGTFKGFIWF